MADIFSRKKRSAVMSALRSRGNAATELRLLALFRAHRLTGWRRGATLRGKAKGRG
jgi:DNA mismatch endonuclease (patch repair protein)